MKKTVQHYFKLSWQLPGCAFLLLLCIPATNLFAQNDTSKKLKQVTISTSAVQKPQLIVPSQTISSSDFIRNNAFTIADAVRNFSGVIIKDYGGIGGLKTISVRGLGANHTAILYDGVQINDAENGQVDLGKLNLNNVQSITLYNGQPPNILQTARAFAAASVLSIETTKPKLTIEKPYLISVGIKGGSFGLVNPNLQWQQRLNDRWSFILNGYTEHANGQYKYLIYDGATTTRQTRTGSAIAAQQIDGALYWNNSDSSNFNLHVNYYNSDRGLPGAVILYTPPPNGQRLWTRDLFVQGGYEHTWPSGLQLLINTKFSVNKLRYLDPQFANTAGFLDQHFSQREYYQSAAVTYHILSNWHVSYATDLSLNNMDADLPNFRYPTRITLLNVFASNLILGDLTLQGSLLNTNTAEQVRIGTTLPGRNAFSPTIMATFKPFDDKNFQLRGFYKQIFRLPTFNELYYGFSPNTTLKPEYTNQYDFGLSYTKSVTGLFEYITLTADAYYNNVTNKIVFIPSLYNGSTQNFGKVDIKGIDAGMKTQLHLIGSYKLSLTANYSYQRAIDITDPTSSTYLNQLPYIPENTLAINAGINRRGWGVYYNQVFSSSRYFDNNNLPADFMPAYAISSASIAYKGQINRLPVFLSAGVDNLFNKDYVIVQSYPMPGRSYRISFQISI